MDRQDYPQLIREKYQKVMAKFTYNGKEPEAKERLRHLYSNHFTSVSSMAPEPQDWTADGMKWVNNHIDELWEMGVGKL